MMSSILKKATILLVIMSSLVSLHESVTITCPADHGYTRELTTLGPRYVWLGYTYDRYVTTDDSATCGDIVCIVDDRIWNGYEERQLVTDGEQDIICGCSNDPSVDCIFTVNVLLGNEAIDPNAGFDLSKVYMEQMYMWCPINSDIHLGVNDVGEMVYTYNDVRPSIAVETTSEWDLSIVDCPIIECQYTDSDNNSGTFELDPSEPWSENVIFTTTANSVSVTSCASMCYPASNEFSNPELQWHEREMTCKKNKGFNLIRDPTA